MLVLCDVYELLDKPIGLSTASSVNVVQNPALRFEWPSLMLFNNSLCKKLTPEYIDNPKTAPQSFEWATGVGKLPAEYNHCIGYDDKRTDAKIVHFTQGIPCFAETEDSEYAKEWKEEFDMCRASVMWSEIMGNSVHAKPVLERMQRRLNAQ